MMYNINSTNFGPIKGYSGLLHLYLHIGYTVAVRIRQYKCGKPQTYYTTGNREVKKFSLNSA